MNFNSIIFPAPTTDKSLIIQMYKDEILFIPKKLPDGSTFHIPCLFKPSQKNDKSNKVFLYFHGNAEDIFNSTNNLHFINSTLPFHTISVEYPGYSIYFQDKNAETIEEDCLTVFDFLVNECKVKPKNIICCGRSIGTGPATYLASKRKPGALILISPIKSIQSAAQSLLGLMRYIVKDRFNNFERLKDVTCPLLIIHGQKDSLIPVEQAIQLSERTGGPYELVLPDKMNHNEVRVYEDFLDPITNFLKRHNLLATDQSQIDINQDYFQVPEYLHNEELSNQDGVSEFIRKFLKI